MLEVVLHVATVLTPADPEGLHGLLETKKTLRELHPTFTSCKLVLLSKLTGKRRQRRLQQEPTQESGARLNFSDLRDKGGQKRRRAELDLIWFQHEAQFSLIRGEIFVRPISTYFVPSTSDVPWDHAPEGSGFLWWIQGRGQTGFNQK